MIGKLGYVKQALKVRFQLHESAEVRNLGNLAPDDVSGNVFVGNSPNPRIFIHLLNPERNSSLLLVHFKNDAPNLFALLHRFAWVAELPRPAQIRDMDHSVNARLDFNKGAEIRYAADFGRNNRTDRIFLRGNRPRISLSLFQAEGNLLLLLVHTEHDDLNFVAKIDHLTGMG